MYADQSPYVSSSALKPGSCSQALWDNIHCSGTFVTKYIKANVAIVADMATTTTTVTGSTANSTTTTTTTTTTCEGRWIAETGFYIWESRRWECTASKDRISVATRSLRLMPCLIALSFLCASSTWVEYLFLGGIVVSHLWQ